MDDKESAIAKKTAYFLPLDLKIKTPLSNAVGVERSKVSDCFSAFIDLSNFNVKAEMQTMRIVVRSGVATGSNN